MIIEANGRFYTTTFHAEEQILKRGIALGHIKHVLENAIPETNQKGNDVFIYKVDKGAPLAVVVSEDEERIVTVYRVG